MLIYLFLGVHLLILAAKEYMIGDSEQRRQSRQEEFNLGENRLQRSNYLILLYIIIVVKCYIE